MATKDENLIEVQWAAHSDPSKVGQKERLRPETARSAIRTGMARYVNDKDVPPARPSMETREDALVASKKSGRASKQEASGAAGGDDAGKQSPAAASTKATGKN